MASSTEHTIKATALPSITRFLEAQVNITSPANNAKLGTSFTMTGGASCEAFRDDGAEVISEGDSTQSITAIDVRLGGNTNPFQRATPTGPSAKPWQSWSFAVNTAPQGALTITARVSAARSGYTGDSATAARQVTVDVTPPTLTINPPATITKSAPPTRRPSRGQPPMPPRGSQRWSGASAAAARSSPPRGRRAGRPR